MGDLGKLLPHASGEDKLQEWRLPVLVYDHNNGDKFKVVEIYEDEGILCIDIDVPKE